MCPGMGLIYYPPFEAEQGGELRAQRRKTARISQYLLYQFLSLAWITESGTEPSFCSNLSQWGGTDSTLTWKNWASHNPDNIQCPLRISYGSLDLCIHRDYRRQQDKYTDKPFAIFCSFFGNNNRNIWKCFTRTQYLIMPSIYIEQWKHACFTPQLKWYNSLKEIPSFHNYHPTVFYTIWKYCGSLV